nr:putative heat shock protein 70 family [Tanacetum cinerariifolium]
MAGNGNEAPAIGIDLGTTYSCVAVWKNEKIEVIPNDQGNRTTPSCVSFHNEELLIGEGAMNQVAMNPANTIFDAKRLIGRRFSDAKLQEGMKLWPFRVIPGPADTPKILVTYKGQIKELFAEEISSMILGKMKATVEASLGKIVNDAVITVPAYFNDSQRQATKDAGTIAGLNIVRVINEPTAAAIAYGMDNKSAINGKINVLIFDLGGGTFDVSLMTIEEGGIFEVKAVAGDTHLGGEDFDNNMVDHCVREFRRRWNKDLTSNQRALGRLRVACEKAKRVLTSTAQTSIELDYLHEGIDFSMRFTRAKFEELNMSLFDKCINTLEKCLNDAGLKKAWVDEIILVGGSTRIPMVQRMLEDFFHGKKLCKSLHPDEAVAYGAAAMATKLSGIHISDSSIRDLQLSDVTPLSLGVEIAGGLFDVLIPGNTQIPTKKDKIYTTSIDSQYFLNFKVYQGERTRSVDNHFLAELKVSGIPPAPKTVPCIKICFEIDENGILTLTAEILSTGMMRKLTIMSENGRLSPIEIENMVKDIERYKHEDQHFKMKTDAYIALEVCVSEMNNKIKEYALQKTVHPKNLKKMEKAITEITKWLQQDNQTASFSELEQKKMMLLRDMARLQNEKGSSSWFGSLFRPAE